MKDPFDEIAEDGAKLAEAAEKAKAEKSQITAADAAVIVQMADCCDSEGIGPDATELLYEIARQHPGIFKEHKHIRPFNSPDK